MNPAPSGEQAEITQQLAVTLNTPARAAGLLPAIGGFNLGAPDDYRVPDGAIHRSGADRMYYETAALVHQVDNAAAKAARKRLADMIRTGSFPYLIDVEPAKEVKHLGLIANYDD